MSGGVGFGYQFFVKDMGLEFSTNLLISGTSSSKILFAGTEETEETVSESVFSSETISGSDTRKEHNPFMVSEPLFSGRW